MTLCCSQQVNALPDTIYFSEDWHITSKNEYKYYRVITIDNDTITIKDHYTNGMLEKVGSLPYSEKSLEKATTCQHLEGCKLGEFMWFHANGTLYRSLNYNPCLVGMDSLLLAGVNKDSLRYEKTYFINGNVNEEGLITPDGLPHGLRIKHHRQGPKSSETLYNKGIRYGTRYTYRTDGIMISSTEYENDLRHGTQKMFDNKGRLKLTRVYDQGNVKKEHKRYLSINIFR